MNPNEEQEKSCCEHKHEHHEHDENCGCKHEHKHDEHCGHEHEHHEHDENCGCKHEHKHDEHCGHEHEHHEHDENCGCEHEHKHEREKVEGLRLDIDEHESSMVATYGFTVNAPKLKAKELCEAFIESVGEKVEEAGGIIGHIKAVLRLSDESYRLSLTYAGKADVDIINGDAAIIEGVAIVFNLSDEALESIIIKSYTTIKINQ